MTIEYTNKLSDDQLEDVSGGIIEAPMHPATPVGTDQPSAEDAFRHPDAVIPFAMPNVGSDG